jgi:hypothetical protein
LPDEGPLFHVHGPPVTQVPVVVLHVAPAGHEAHAAPAAPHIAGDCEP